ncbi:MAG: hypothetical protein KC561_10365 [Myxococcales bacterium]|nr:hypothetical protein [Myxococcales bacterium]
MFSFARALLGAALLAAAAAAGKDVYGKYRHLTPWNADDESGTDLKARIADLERELAELKANKAGA